MARTLFLHIGNHKTGSTSIQYALSRLEDARVFNKISDPKVHAKLSNWFGNSWLRGQGDPRQESIGVDERLAGELAAHNPGGDVVFSAEDFSWVFAHEAIEDFAKSLRADFDEVKIIVYLRRQDRAAVSFYQQGLPSRHSRIGRFMGHDALSLPEYKPYFDLYFDYHQRLGIWGDLFGDEAMRFRVFGEVIRERPIVEDFAETAGIEIEKSDVHSRKSISKAEQLLTMRMLQVEFDIELPHELKKLMLTGEKSRPPKARAETFYQIYKESNARLDARFQIKNDGVVFDEDFSEYTPEGYENWDPESARQVVDFLLMAFAQSDERHRQVEDRRQELRQRLNRRTRLLNELSKSEPEKSEQEE